MKTYMIKNLITGEIKGKCVVNSLEAAQEYFDIMLPFMTSNDMLFEIK